MTCDNITSIRCARAFSPGHITGFFENPIKLYTIIIFFMVLQDLVSPLVRALLHMLKFPKIIQNNMMFILIKIRLKMHEFLIG